MHQYLIDVNLPYYFSLWKGKEYIHLKDINQEWPDEKVWNYALKNNLTIVVTKDCDFSKRIILKEPPPKVIHIKLGNMRQKEM